jgi:hypothetical protein
MRGKSHGISGFGTNRTNRAYLEMSVGSGQTGQTGAFDPSRKSAISKSYCAKPPLNVFQL